MPFLVTSQVHERPYLKQRKRWKVPEEGHLRLSSDLHMKTHTCTPHTHIDTPPHMNVHRQQPGKQKPTAAEARGLTASVPAGHLLLRAQSTLCSAALPHSGHAWLWRPEVSMPTSHRAHSRITHLPQSSFLFPVPNFCCSHKEPVESAKSLLQNKTTVQFQELGISCVCVCVCYGTCMIVDKFKSALSTFTGAPGI